MSTYKILTRKVEEEAYVC